MMRISVMLRTGMLSLLLLLVASVIQSASANLSNEIHIYEYTLHDLTVRVENPLEAYPNQTMNINITAEASAKLTINYTAIELYTFSNLTMTDEKFDCIIHVEEENPVLLLGGELLNETCYNVTIPEYASNIVYGKLILLWTEKGTEESTSYRREPTFIVTYLRSPELENLRSKVSELEEENNELKGNITDLNSTLAELLDELSDIENRFEGELSGTRNVVTILAISTVFFVATTAYLSIRKPKQQW